MEVTQEEIILLQQALWDRATGRKTYWLRDRRTIRRDFLPFVDWSGRTRIQIIVTHRSRRRNNRGRPVTFDWNR